MENCFLKFTTPIDGIALPEKFTFPFYYQPHPLVEIAAKELTQIIQNINWNHDFEAVKGAPNTAVGKMFGVLVVKNKNNEIGYLAAYSGKIGEESTVEPFVPPIYDRLTHNSYFSQQEKALDQYSAEILAIQNNEEFLQLKETLQATRFKFEQEIALLKKDYKQGQKDRKAKRATLVGLPEVEIQFALEEMKDESLRQQYFIKQKNKEASASIEKIQSQIDQFESRIQNIKNVRRAKSNELQKWLFEQHHFFNQKKEIKNLTEIFTTTPPPSGAGECAAPKLLQFAFEHDYEIIAMGEFWWGKSPNTVVRKHLNFYPSCKGKCEPILGHMLSETITDPNPMLENPAEGKKIEIIFEDEHLVVVNKPAEFLSVPGKTISDSVQTRLEAMYPECENILLVHRLDMSTSGILIAAKTKNAHHQLQSQFIKRTVKKRYVALLNGNIPSNGGLIDLPLRLDIDNRPFQCVCFEHGKKAQTQWAKISSENNQTKVYFYPITGRTHQLRVHAAHHLGLNAPIVGDDLYGTKSNRLHLHAESIEFTHPETKKPITIKVNAPF